MPYADPEDRRRYYLRNRERIRKVHAAWAAKNKAYRNQYAKKRRQKNLRVSEVARKYYEKNRAKTAKRYAIYYVKNRAKIAKFKTRPEGREISLTATRKRQAIKIDATCDCCSNDDFRKIYEKASTRGMHVDHIYPLSKGGAHCCKNLQLLTPSKNLSKGTKIDAWQKVASN